MSRRFVKENVGDGLSIAVWEGSPWSAFVRFRDTSDGGSHAETSKALHMRPGQARPQEADDVGEIFGRVMDVARSKKSFVSAASVVSVRKDATKSEARIMAEDARSWGVSNREHRACHDIDDFELTDDGEEEEAKPVADTPASPRLPTESFPGPFSRNSSVCARTASNLSTHPRRGTATSGGAAAEIVAHENGGSGGGTEWAAPALPVASRAPTRLQLLLTTPASSGELQPQQSSQARSPQGSNSPAVDAAAGSGPGRARGARATAYGASCGATAGARLLYVQAANMPVRNSLELHTSRKTLSPGAAVPPRRSNSFDSGRPDGAAAVASGGPSAAATHTASPIYDRNLEASFRDRRCATATGISNHHASMAAAGYGGGGTASFARRGAAGDSGGGAEQQQPPSAAAAASPLHRDGTLMLRGGGGSRSWRATLLAGEGRRLSGSDGGAGGGSGSKSPVLVPSTSGRLPDPYGSRLHPAPKPLRTAAAAAAAAGTPGDQQRLPRCASHSNHPLAQHSSLDVRKHSPAAAGLAGDRSGCSGGGGCSSGAPSPPGAPVTLPGEGRGIMGRLRGLFMYP